MKNEIRFPVKGKAETLRVILSKLKQHLLSNGSSLEMASNGSMMPMSPADEYMLARFEEIRRRREAYINGTVEIGTHFARTYIALGAIAVLLNLTILIILLFHRRHVFRHVFYLLIFNFAIIDCLKGICLITYALRMIKTPSSSRSAQISTFKFDQYMTLVFRFCNLATILNLLMITLNEFVFIKFPLRYHQLINRRLALILIGVNWIVCIIFTIASTFAKGTGGRVFVSANYTNDMINGSGASFFGNKSIMRKEESGGGGMDVHYIFAFTLTSFCMLCMVAVLVCYAIFFQVIREIRQYDNRLYQDANRRPSEVSTNSCDISVNVSDDRKIKRQLLKRNKYALVIGSVILVCMMYLLSYSTIQIFQYLHLSWEKPFTSDPEEHRKSYLVRWVLQILVGLHSVFQPLCYFRMKEFRHVVQRIFCYTRLSYRERDFLTSFVENPNVHQQQQLKQENDSIVVKSTSFRDHIYYIFRKKGASDDKSPKKKHSTYSMNNNKSYNRNNSHHIHQRTSKFSSVDDDELAKELKTLMQNSGTEL